MATAHDLSQQKSIPGFRLWLLIVHLLLGGCSTASARQWTSTDGRTLEAEMLGKVPGREAVRVITAQAQVFVIPLDRLSEEDRHYAFYWEPPERPVPAVEDAVFVLQHGPMRGSGFLLQTDTGVYLYTNQHVIQGGGVNELRATSASGQTIPLGSLEIIPDADLARFAVAMPGGLKIATEATLDSPAIAYGNSQGAGVVTQSQGRILGLGQEHIEVDCEIVPGNSGGPILNERGEVLGVSTFVAILWEEKHEEGNLPEFMQRNDWTTKGTRYDQTRRFGLRLPSSGTWTPVNREHYARQGKALQEISTLFDQWLAVSLRTVNNPLEPMQMDYDLHPMLVNLIQRQIDNSERMDNRLNDSVSPSELDSINRFERRKLADWMEQEVQAMERQLAQAERLHGITEIPFFKQRFELLGQRLERWQAYLDWTARNRDFFVFRNANPYR